MAELQKIIDQVTTFYDKMKNRRSKDDAVKPRIRLLVD